MSRPGDVLVIFGITGDLARVMTFRSLYRLERRGLLRHPIVGVASTDWSTDQLRDHAEQCIRDTGEDLDPEVFARFAERLTYVSGDFNDAATYERVRDALGDASTPVFYLEIPPFLFGPVIAQLADAGLTKDARVVVEKPFGHDLASARALHEEVHRHIDESQLLRIDHFLGKMGLDEVLYLRFANTMLEPVWNRLHLQSVQITMAEDFGVDDRGGFYDPVGALRDVVVNHLMQIVAMTAMEPPAGGDPETLKDGINTVLRSMPAADPEHYVRGQYAGYLDTPGVKEGSTTETFAALRLKVDNWRWYGVPFFLRAGKHLPRRATEVRLVFRHPPRLGFFPQRHDPTPNQLVMRIDPGTGIRTILEARRAYGTKPEAITMDMQFADEGGEGATPYEVLLQAAMDGNTLRFARQDSVEESWRIMEPLLEHPPPVQRYDKGTWGPQQAESIVAGHGTWYGPWVS